MTSFVTSWSPSLNFFLGGGGLGTVDQWALHVEQSPIFIYKMFFSSCLRGICTPIRFQTHSSFSLLIRHFFLISKPLTSHKNDCNVVLFSEMFVDNPQLLSTLNEPPTDSGGNPHQVIGVTILNRHLYVIYENYDVIEEFDCFYRFNKIDDIKVEGLKAPHDMVGCNITQTLFVNDWASDTAAKTVVWRIDLETGVNDVFIQDDGIASLSLVDNRLLMTSRGLLSMHNVLSGERIKNIPLPEDMSTHILWHAIESRRDSFFVIHGLMGLSNTVSEIDSEGRVIRVFNNDEHLVNGGYLALDPVGRLLVADRKNNRIVLLNEFLDFQRVLFDEKRLDNERPWRLSYNKNTDRLAIGLCNGRVKIFECK